MLHGCGCGCEYHIGYSAGVVIRWFLKSQYTDAIIYIIILNLKNKNKIKYYMIKKVYSSCTFTGSSKDNIGLVCIPLKVDIITMV
jgi:hypothetical protein